MLYNDLTLNGFIIYHSVKVQNYKQWCTVLIDLSFNCNNYRDIWSPILATCLTLNLIKGQFDTTRLKLLCTRVTYHVWCPIINTSKLYGPWHINNKHYNYIINWADYFHLYHRKPQPLLNKQYMNMQIFIALTPGYIMHAIYKYSPRVW